MRTSTRSWTKFLAALGYRRTRRRQRTVRRYFEPRRMQFEALEDRRLLAANLSINDVTVTEGQAASFTVVLSEAAAGTVMANYSTTSGTAMSGMDFTMASGSVTFMPGETQKTINVATTDDSQVEASETLYVSLSGVTGATLVDGIGQATILDNDAAATAEIVVSLAGTNIADNTGSVDFGSTPYGAPVTRTFTIQNTGTSALTVGPTVSVPTGYSVVTQPASSVQPDASTTLAIRLDASMGGSYSGTVSFATNDSDESPFNFTVSGSVAAPMPEIRVSAPGGSNVADNSGSVNFGTTSAGAPITQVFTITNDGTAPLSLGTVMVPAGFTVTGQPAATLAAGASTTVTVRLDAAAQGTYSGTLSFTTNDTDENPFNFAISGQVNAAVPEIRMLDGAGTELVDGSGSVDFGTTPFGVPVTRTFTVENVGAAALTLNTQIGLPAGYTLVTAPAATVAAGGSTTLTVRLDASAPGTASGSLVLTNNDGNENPYELALTGVVQAPEIRVLLSGGANLPDGTGQIAFGVTPIGTAVDRTLTIENTGALSLTLGEVLLPTGFVLITAPAASLAPGESTTLTIRMTAAAEGVFGGTLSFATNDPDEDPFDFAVSGEAQGARVRVTSSGGPEIADGTGAFDFGSTAEGSPVTRTFVIENTGLLPLDLGTPTVPQGFTLVTPPASSVQPGASTSFTVRLEAATAGSYSGTVSFGTNDSGRNPFDFQVTGQAVLYPEVAVRLGAANIVSGSTSVDFGPATVGLPVLRTFTVTNEGAAPLTLGPSLNLPSGYSLVQSWSTTTLNPGESTTFTVRLEAAMPGTAAGTISFATNDPNESPFQILVTAQVSPPPEISVVYHVDTTTWQNLADGQSVAEFGATLTGTSVTRTLAIHNSGSGELRLDPASLVLPTGFSLVDPLPTTIASQQSAFISVRLDASQAGLYGGEFSFGTNDADEHPFNFQVNGEVVTPAPEIVVEAIDDIVVATAVDLVDGESGVWLGLTPTGTPVSKTIRIRNVGTADLHFGTNSLAVPQGFSVVGSVPQTLAPGSMADIVIRLDAAAPGQYSGQVTLVSDDADENPFSFAIGGRVWTPQPEIVVAVYSPSMTSVTDLTSGNGLVEFGATALGHPLERTLHVQNLGTGNLQLGQLTLPEGFIVVSGYLPTLMPGGWATLTIRFQGPAPGTYGGDLVLASNDADEAAFHVTLAGIVTPAAPEIEVSFQDAMGQAGAAVANNATDVNLGTTTEGRPIIRTFRVQNMGMGNLTLDAEALVLPEGLSLAAAPAETVGPLSWTTFSVRVDAASAGAIDGEIVLPTNDPDESPFRFAVVAQVDPLPRVTEFRLYHDDGAANDDGITTDPTLTGEVSGTGPWTVEFDLNGDGLVDSVTAAAEDGTFVFTPLRIAPGNLVVLARAAQWDRQTASLLTSEWEPLAFTYVLPPAPEVVELALVNDTGASATDGVTSDPRIAGRLELATGTWQVEIDYTGDETAEVTVTPDAEGQFALTPPILAAGAVTLRARAARWDPAAAGYRYGDWQTLEFTFERVDTNPPRLTSLDLARDTESPGDRVTSDVTLLGRVEGVPDGQSVAVEFDHNGDGVADGTAAVTADGTVRYVPAGLLPGQVTIRARVQAPQGSTNNSEWRTVTFTYSPAVTDRPTVVELRLLDDDGASASDGITSVAAIQGRITDDQSAQGLVVQVDHDGDGDADGTTTTDAFGRFLYAPAGLAEGTVTLRVRAREWDYEEQDFAFGEWTNLAFTLVSGAPNAPVVAELGLLSDSGVSATDGHTANAVIAGLVTIGGSPAAGVLLDVDLGGDGSVDDLTFSDADGAFTYRPASLDYGTVVVQVRPRWWDESQAIVRTGEWTSVSFVYEAQTNQAPRFAELDLLNDTGASSTDGVTSDPTIAGRLTNEATVDGLTVELDLDADGVADATVVTDARGRFSITPDLALGPAEIALRTQETDAATGAVLNGVWTPLELTYAPADNAPPVVVDVALLHDTLDSSTDGLTSDATLAGRVTNDGSVAGLIVEFDHNGDDVPDGIAVADDEGRFVYLPSGLDLGPATIRARAKESVGASQQTGAWSALSLTLVVDPEAPPGIVGLHLVEDTGASDTDRSTSDPTLAGQVVVADVTGTVVYFDHDGDETPDGSATVTADGEFEYTPQDLPEGRVEIRARAVRTVDGTSSIGDWVTLRYVLASDPDSATAQDALAALTAFETTLLDADAAQAAQTSAADAAYATSLQGSASAYRDALGQAIVSQQAAVAQSQASYQAAVASADAAYRAALEAASAAYATAAASYSGNVTNYSAQSTQLAPLAQTGAPTASNGTALQPPSGIAGPSSMGPQFAVYQDPTFQQAMTDAWQAYSAASAAASAQYQAAVQDARLDFMAAQSAANQQLQSDGQDAQADAQQIIQATNPIDLQQAQEDYQDAVSAATTDYNDAISDALDAYNDAAESANQVLADATNDAAQDRAAALGSAQQTRDAEIADAQQDAAAAQAQHDAQVVYLSEQRFKFNESLQGCVFVSLGDIALAEAANVVLLDASQSTAQQRINDAHQAYNDAAADAERDYQVAVANATHVRNEALAEARRQYVVASENALKTQTDAIAQAERTLADRQIEHQRIEHDQQADASQLLRNRGAESTATATQSLAAARYAEAVAIAEARRTLLLDQVAATTAFNNAMAAAAANAHADWASAVATPWADYQAELAAINADYVQAVSAAATAQALAKADAGRTLDVAEADANRDYEQQAATARRLHTIAASGTAHTHHLAVNAAQADANQQNADAHRDRVQDNADAGRDYGVATADPEKQAGVSLSDARRDLRIAQANAQAQFQHTGDTQAYGAAMAAAAQAYEDARQVASDALGDALAPLAEALNDARAVATLDFWVDVADAAADLVGAEALSGASAETGVLAAVRNHSQDVLVEGTQRQAAIFQAQATYYAAVAAADTAYTIAVAAADVTGTVADVQAWADFQVVEATHYADAMLVWATAVGTPWAQYQAALAAAALDATIARGAADVADAQSVATAQAAADTAAAQALEARVVAEVQAQIASQTAAHAAVTVSSASGRDAGNAHSQSVTAAEAGYEIALANAQEKVEVAEHSVFAAIAQTGVALRVAGNEIAEDLYFMPGVASMGRAMQGAGVVIEAAAMQMQLPLMVNAKVVYVAEAGAARTDYLTTVSAANVSFATSLSSGELGYTTAIAEANRVYAGAVADAHAAYDAGLAGSEQTLAQSLADAAEVYANSRAAIDAAYDTAAAAARVAYDLEVAENRALALDDAALAAAALAHGAWARYLADVAAADLAWYQAETAARTAYVAAATQADVDYAAELALADRDLDYAVADADQVYGTAKAATTQQGRKDLAAAESATAALAASALQTFTVAHAQADKVYNDARAVAQEAYDNALAQAGAAFALDLMDDKTEWFLEIIDDTTYNTRQSDRSLVLDKDKSIARLTFVTLEQDALLAWTVTTADADVARYTADIDATTTLDVARSTVAAAAANADQTAKTGRATSIYAALTIHGNAVAEADQAYTLAIVAADGVYLAATGVADVDWAGLAAAADVDYQIAVADRRAAELHDAALTTDQFYLADLAAAQADWLADVKADIVDHATAVAQAAADFANAEHQADADHKAAIETANVAHAAELGAALEVRGVALATATYEEEAAAAIRESEHAHAAFVAGQESLRDTSPARRDHVVALAHADHDRAVNAAALDRDHYDGSYDPPSGAPTTPEENQQQWQDAKDSAEAVWKEAKADATLGWSVAVAAADETFQVSEALGKHDRSLASTAAEAIFALDEAEADNTWDQAAHAADAARYLAVAQAGRDRTVSEAEADADLTVAEAAARFAVLQPLAITYDTAWANYQAALASAESQYAADAAPDWVAFQTDLADAGVTYAQQLAPAWQTWQDAGSDADLAYTQEVVPAWEDGSSAMADARLGFTVAVAGAQETWRVAKAVHQRDYEVAVAYSSDPSSTAAASADRTANDAAARADFNAAHAAAAKDQALARAAAQLDYALARAAAAEGKSLSRADAQHVYDVVLANAEAAYDAFVATAETAYEVANSQTYAAHLAALANTQSPYSVRAAADAQAVADRAAATATATLTERLAKIEAARQRALGQAAARQDFAAGQAALYHDRTDAAAQAAHGRSAAQANALPGQAAAGHYAGWLLGAPQAGGVLIDGTAGVAEGAPTDFASAISELGWQGIDAGSAAVADQFVGLLENMFYQFPQDEYSSALFRLLGEGLIRPAIGDARLAAASDMDLIVGTAAFSAGIVLSAYAALVVGPAAAASGTWGSVAALVGTSFVGGFSLSVAGQIIGGASVQDVDWTAATLAGGKEVLFNLAGSGVLGKLVGPLSTVLKPGLGRFACPVAKWTLRAVPLLVGGSDVYGGVQQIRAGNTAAGVMQILGGLAMMGAAFRIGGACFVAGTHVWLGSAEAQALGLGHADASPAEPGEGDAGHAELLGWAAGVVVVGLAGCVVLERRRKRAAGQAEDESQDGWVEGEEEDHAEDEQEDETAANAHNNFWSRLGRGEEELPEVALHIEGQTATRRPRKLDGAIGACETAGMLDAMLDELAGTALLTSGARPKSVPSPSGRGQGEGGRMGATYGSPASASARKGTTAAKRAPHWGFYWLAACLLLAAYLGYRAWPRTAPSELLAAPAVAAGVSQEVGDALSKPIEEFEVGDYVLARDPATGLTEPRRVVETYRRVADHLRILQFVAVDDAGTTQRLQTTDEHPFWTEESGWVNAGQLQVGQRIEQLDGTAAVVIATRREEHPEGIEVFNLQVEGLHTYFASATSAVQPVLVHNANYTPSGTQNAQTAWSARTGRAYDRRVRNLWRQFEGQDIGGGWRVASVNRKLAKGIQPDLVFQNDNLKLIHVVDVTSRMNPAHLAKGARYQQFLRSRYPGYSVEYFENYWSGLENIVEATSSAGVKYLPGLSLP
jgi:hypothetical protein